ncbi:MAG: rhomboid family intramembrane serine protease [Kofleriaceae bacterium]
MRRSSLTTIDPNSYRITRMAMLFLFALVGISLVYGLSNDTAQVRMLEWVAPSGDAVWRRGRLWTLFTGPFLEPRFLSLLIEGMMMWLLMPRLERWWGPARFALFVGATAVAATVGGTLVGLALDRPDVVLGLNPTIIAGTIAFGILYARQPIQFFGVVPLTGRQFMWGMIALMSLFVLLGQEWVEGGAMAAASLVGAGLASGRLDPIATWRRRKFAKSRAHLTVVPAPEVSTIPRRSKSDDRYLN